MIEESVVALKEITAGDGKSYSTKVYNLNALISVGYRVESKHGTLFRIWATDKIIQYLTKGFVMDDERLKDPDGRPDFFDELLERIRDIRSSENQDDKERFFATIQNAMHWAVTQETAAEVIFHRVDASKPNAGVIHFAGEQPTVAEAKIAKNLYFEPEINALNLLTSATLEFFASQAEQRKPTSIAQFLEKMREFIKLDGRPLIPSGHLGRISMPKAKEKAAAEIAVYKERMRLKKENEGRVAVEDLLEQSKKIATAKRAKRKNKST